MLSYTDSWYLVPFSSNISCNRKHNVCLFYDHRVKRFVYQSPNKQFRAGWENEWGYNSKPLHECAGHLNGRRFGAFVRWGFKRIWCIRRIKVKDHILIFSVIFQHQSQHFAHMYETWKSHHSFLKKSKATTANYFEFVVPLHQVFLALIGRLPHRTSPTKRNHFELDQDFMEAILPFLHAQSADQNKCLSSHVQTESSKYGWTPSCRKCSL